MDDDQRRTEQVGRNLDRAKRFLHEVIDSPRLLDLVEDGDAIILGDAYDPPPSE